MAGSSLETVLQEQAKFQQVANQIAMQTREYVELNVPIAQALAVEIQTQALEIQAQMQVREMPLIQALTHVIPPPEHGTEYRFLVDTVNPERGPRVDALEHARNPNTVTIPGAIISNQQTWFLVNNVTGSSIYIQLPSPLTSSSTSDTINVTIMRNAAIWNEWVRHHNHRSTATSYTSCTSCNTVQTTDTAWYTFCQEAMSDAHSLVSERAWRRQVKEHELTIEERELMEYKRQRAGWLEMWARAGNDYRLKVEEEERKEAQKRANKLLVEFLSEEQKASLEKNGYFLVEVEVSKKKRIYRLDVKRPGVIEQDEKGKAIFSYCIHPRVGFKIPREDDMLALKFMIETDHSLFQKTANRTPYYN